MNEEKNVSLLHERILKAISIHSDYEIIYVDDGSKDNTFSEIFKLSEKDTKVKYISFSRNFGHQNALKAGIDYATGDCIISLDGDLQHPPELIPKLIKKWKKGFDVVFTIRKPDPNLGKVKNITSKGFYWLINKLSDTKISEGSADYRLIDRKVAEYIKSLNESPIFFRGMIPWLGFKQYSIEYTPEARIHGTTKYSLKKMLQFAITGITSFSISPLKFGYHFGICFICISLSLAAIQIYLFATNAGISNLIVFSGVLFLLFGFQMLLVGIIGEYIGKILALSRGRPSYIIKSKNL